MNKKTILLWVIGVACVVVISLTLCLELMMRLDVASLDPEPVEIEKHGLFGIDPSECSRVKTLGQLALPSLLDRVAAEPDPDKFGNAAVDRRIAAKNALVLLGQIKRPEALPALREYVANPKSENPVLALRSMLLIENSAAMREFVARALKSWMPRVGSILPDSPPQWSDVEQGFVPYIVLAPLPEKDIVDIAMRAHLPDSDMRVAIFYRLGLQARYSRCIAVLRACSKCGTDKHKLVVKEIEEAAKTHNEHLGYLLRMTKPPTNTKRVWTDDDWQASRKKEIARLKAALTNLEALKKEIGP